MEKTTLRMGEIILLTGKTILGMAGMILQTGETISGMGEIILQTGETTLRMGEMTLLVRNVISQIFRNHRMVIFLCRVPRAAPPFAINIILLKPGIIHNFDIRQLLFHF